MGTLQTDIGDKVWTADDVVNVRKEPIAIELEVHGKVRPNGYETLKSSI